MLKKNLHNSGLTLIEVLVSVVILGMLGGGLLTLQYVLGENQTLVMKNYRSVDEANSYVTKFVREIRVARTGENAAYTLDTVDDYEIIFYSDIDFDDEVEKVRYSVNGTQLTKGVIEPVGYPATYPNSDEKTTIISTNIRNLSEPAFYYYNGDWPQDTDNNPLSQSERLSETKTVRIYLRLNQSADNADNDFILESYAQIRMLKDNL